MAGAGYKLFNTGDVLTAAQVNTYLMEQTVMVFADAAARTAALTGVVSEGMISYLKDTNAVEVYNGSAWVASDDPNAIQNTIVDAKGDLITATANDTPARLAVGNNGEVLIAASGETTGLKWAKSANFVGCSLYNSGTTNQVIGNVTFTAVTFDNESFDTDGFHSTSTNTSRVTIPAGLGGKYQITASSLWDPNGTGYRTLALYKNGSSEGTGVEQPGHASYYIGQTRVWTVNLAAGDYIELFAYQSSGGNLALYKRYVDFPLSVQYLGA